MTECKCYLRDGFCVRCRMANELAFPKVGGPAAVQAEIAALDKRRQDGVA